MNNCDTGGEAVRKEFGSHLELVEEVGALERGDDPLRPPRLRGFLLPWMFQVLRQIAVLPLR
jgi:hypothetical protein